MQHHQLFLKDWQETKTALHCFLQITGKIRMKLHPKRNHWWHVTHYLSQRGLTTGVIPYQGKAFEMEFDFIEHLCRVSDSENQTEIIKLKGLSVSEFYQQLLQKLSAMQIKVEILAKPFDPIRVQSDIPFIEDKIHIYKNTNAVTQFWKILLWTYPIFAEFCSYFDGKTTPQHLYWHSMDYVITRFSGRKAPVIEGMDPVSAEAYSDEVISFGFWPGDKDLGEPAFYSYTYPAPDGLMQQVLKPGEAAWVEVNQSPMALLKYHDLIQLSDPAKGLMDFLHTAYDAGAKLAKYQVRPCS